MPAPTLRSADAAADFRADVFGDTPPALLPLSLICAIIFLFFFLLLSFALPAARAMPAGFAFMIRWPSLRRCPPPRRHMLADAVFEAIAAAADNAAFLRFDAMPRQLR